MSDTLRSQMLRIASELPKGDATRRKLLVALQDKNASTYEVDVVEVFPLRNGKTSVDFKMPGARSVLTDTVRGEVDYGDKLTVSADGRIVLVNGKPAR